MTPTPRGFAQRLLRSSGAAAFSQVWRFGVTFATQAVLRRLVAPEGWGLWHWAIDFLFLVVGQLRDLGLPAHVVRDATRPYGQYLVVEIVLGMVLGGVLFAVAPLLESPKTDAFLVPLVQLLVLFFIFEGLAKVPLTFFEAELRIDEALVPELVRNLCYAALALVLAWRGFDVLAMGIAHVVATAVFAALLWWRAWPTIPLSWAKGSSFAKLARGGLPLMWMAIVLLALDSVDFQILKMSFDDAVVGIYGGALMLAMLVPRMLEYPLRRALYPAFVKVQNDAARFFDTYRLSTIFLMSVHLLAAGLLWINAETLLVLLWGETYAAAAPFLRLLCLVPLMQPLTRCAEDVLLPRHEESWLIAGSVVNLVSLVSLGFWLTADAGSLHAGPVGMAWAKLAPVGTLLVAWAVYRIHRPGFRRLMLDLGLIYAIAGSAFTLAWVLSPANPWGRMAVSTAAALLVLGIYAAIYWRGYRGYFRILSEKREGPSEAVVESSTELV